MRTLARSSFTFLLCTLGTGLVAGCGVRTGLEIGDDGSVRSDGALADGGMDAPWDGGSCTNDSDCDDLAFCNGFEVCVSGLCQRGAPTDCSDGIPCTLDQCVEGGGCVSRPDDTLCPAGMRCDAAGGGCVPNTMRCTNDFECDDRQACNGIERCDVSTGLCVAGPPMNCSDGVSCTDDSCVEGFGCAHAANSAECPVGQICDPMIGCQTRSCGPTGSCDDGDPCNGAEFCSADGRCFAGSPLVCNDGNPCTNDFCVTGIGCQTSRRPEVCADGTDNDCNGLTDCADPMCIGTTGCGMCVPSAPFEANCGDGRDDDCNGLTDCIDPICAMQPVCMGTCVPVSPIETSCFDFRDDDCNGAIDCADPACAGTPGCGMVCTFPEDCHNGIDDDCNGPMDCMDPFCIMTDPSCGPVCTPTAPFERRCTDGLDDDCDGRIDCADRDCRGRPGCNDAGVGSDGGVAPEAGPTDAGPRDTGPRDTGVRDAGGTVRNEIGVAACTNGIDDDRDGRADCADPDCSPFGPMGECCNGRDDTGDGNIDEFTCRCFDNSFCGTVGSLDQVCWLSSYSVCAPRCNFYGGNTFCQMYLPTTPTCNVMTGECQ